MSIDDTVAEETRTVDYAQYVVVAVLLLVGGFLIYTGLTLDEGFAKVDPVGPKFFPLIVGVAALVLGVVLAVAIRGAARARPTPARTSTPPKRRETGAPSGC